VSREGDKPPWGQKIWFSTTAARGRWSNVSVMYRHTSVIGKEKGQSLPS
jgi:hypothetical protein